MTSFNILLLGFSIISALIFFVAYVFFFKNVNKSWHAILACFGLLLCLSLIQYSHLNFYLTQVSAFDSLLYRFCLFLVPTCFYFFSRATLLSDAKLNPWMLLHFVPVMVNPFIRTEIAIPLTFLIGMAYCFWFANIIYGMKSQRQRFKFEIFFFGLFSVIAVLVLILGFAMPYMPHKFFFWFYGGSIGLCFILIMTALLIFPDLLSDIADAAKFRYASSTLGDINISEHLSKLDKLMREDKLYQNENLNLAMVAHELDLSSHQLSELINVQFGMNFSRYIREQRIAAAKQLLANEPDSSVLAIGLETGFKSQSNFYAAFKEITGMSPGAYRDSLANSLGSQAQGVRL